MREAGFLLLPTLKIREKTFFLPFEYQSVNQRVKLESISFLSFFYPKRVENCEPVSRHITLVQAFYPATRLLYLCLDMNVRVVVVFSTL